MIWLVLALAILAAALLAGIESALIGVSRVRVRHAADEGDRQARRLAAMLEKRQELLRAAMTAHHLCSIAAFAMIAVLCRRLLGPWTGLLVIVAAVPVFLIGLELAPKALFRLYPFRTLRRLTPFLALLEITARPWRVFSRPAAGAAAGPERNSREGVTQLADNIIALKLLPENAAILLSNYARFAAIDARDIAIPLNGVSAMPAGMPLQSVMPMAAQTAQRFHPVLDENGELIGYLDAAALPPNPPRERVVRQFTQPAPHVAASDPALHCLQTLRKSAAPLAIVTDGKPGASGVLLLEPLLGRLMNLAEPARRSGRKKA